MADKDVIQAFNNLLDTELFSFSEHIFTVGELLLIPTIVAIGLLFTKWLVAFVAKRMEKHGAAADAIHLVRRLVYITALVVLFITVLDLINVPITAFAFVSGAVAIGFGFGAQNIINNFISGWILMWERPIRINDFLEVDGVKGRVESINTRSTRIRRVDGVHMLIPNSKLLENTVVNWTLVDKLTRTSVKVGVAYGSPVKRVAILIEEAMHAQADVLADPAPLVIFEDFGDNALIFEAYFWVRASIDKDLRVIRSNIRFHIDQSFADEDIVIAYPQRDVHIDGSLKLTQASVAPDA